MKQVNASVIKAEEISVTYQKSSKSFQALTNISLTFDPNQLTCLIGPSGSGKSTLLKALVGIVPIDTGAVHLGQEILATAADGTRHDFSNDRCSTRQQVAWMAQDLCLSLNSTALKNVCCGSLHQMSIWKTLLTGFSHETRDEAYHLLKKLGVEAKIHEKVKRLSGGQRQRVAFARAMMQDASWILADEPFSALDEGTQQQMIDRMKELKNQKHGLLVVLHDIDVACQIADRILGIHNGGIIFDGTPSELTTDIRQKIFNL